MSENRAPAQYCPYCGETNLWPHEESHGAWRCGDCHRVFAVRFIGITGRDVDSSASTPPTGPAPAAGKGSGAPEAPLVPVVSASASGAGR